MVIRATVNFGVIVERRKHPAWGGLRAAIRSHPLFGCFVLEFLAPEFKYGI